MNSIKEKHLATVEAVEGLREVCHNKHFPLDIFPHNLLDVATKMAHSFCVNIEPILISMLTILSAAIGNSVRISPKESWRESPFLWCVMYGHSGAGKTPFIAALMKPIYTLQSKAIKDAKGGNQKHYIVSDITVEALFEVMQTTPRGVLAYHDELSGFIGGHDQYKGKGNDRQKYIELWGCQPWKKDRAGDGMKYVKDTGCSILGGIQSLAIKTVFGQHSIIDGLLPRFLFVSVVKRPYSKASVPTEDMKQWEQLLRRCYDMLLDKDENGFVVHKTLKFSEAAHDTFGQFHDEYNRLIKNAPYEDMEVFVPKLISYAVRLAGILHIIGDEGEIINDQTVKNACRLVDFFYGQVVEVLDLCGQARRKHDEIRGAILEGLRTSEDRVKNGKVLLKALSPAINEMLSPICQLTNQQTAYELRKLGLSTKRIGGYSHLIWEPLLIQRITGC